MARFKKINKRVARKLYETYKPFVMCASNLRPDMFGCVIDADNKHDMTDVTFDELVNEFYAYNCTNSETGRRVAFYVKEVA